MRRARVAEAEALSALALRSKALWGYDTAFLEACRAELTVAPEAIEAGEVWVAERDGAVVGLLEIVPHGAEAELRLIFVAPESIGGGIGAALFAHAEQRARMCGARAIALDSDPNALGFYQRMGMRVIGRRPSGSIPGRFLPRLRKALPPAA